MKLLFIESHQYRGYKEVEHYKRHEYDTGSDQESTQNWIVIQNLQVEGNDPMNNKSSQPEWQCNSV